MSIQDVLTAINDRNLNPRKSGDGFNALCPAHADHHQSLSVNTGSYGRVLVHCHTGCDTGDVIDALGLEWRDLFHKKGELNGIGG